MCARLLNRQGSANRVHVQAPTSVFLFATAPRPALWRTLPPLPWSGFWKAVSMEVQRPEGEVKRLRESSVEVKNYWSYVTTLH
jgi:hypothetical protein